MGTCFEFAKLILVERSSLPFLSIITTAIISLWARNSHLNMIRYSQWVLQWLRTEKNTSESFTSKEALMWASCKSGNEAKKYKIIGPQAAEEVTIHKGSTSSSFQHKTSSLASNSPSLLLSLRHLTENCRSFLVDLLFCSSLTSASKTYLNSQLNSQRPHKWPAAALSS